MKFVAFNGPPGCGKDHIATRVMAATDPSLSPIIVKFAKPLKEMVHAAHGLTDYDGLPLPHHYFETSKDEPQQCLNGRTMREAYKRMSEHYVKPMLGERYFGEKLAKQFNWTIGMDKVVLCSDSGFAHELAPVIEDGHDVYVVRIHRTGCDFSNDTRAYLNRGMIQAALRHSSKISNVRFLSLHNDGDLNIPELLTCLMIKEN